MRVGIYRRSRVGGGRGIDREWGGRGESGDIQEE